jgi:ABC-type uncharacterized transport system substrate-binding protein
MGIEPTQPVTKNGGKWRIAYYEGGAYVDYKDCMRSIIGGLMSLGWIDKAELPRLGGDVPKPYWNWLSKGSKSRFLTFREKDAYSALWSDEQRATTRVEVLKKLQSGDIDLIIAMGTWAGQDLANNRHHVPTTVVSTSDPINAKIIRSAEDSGLDHVTARVDPDRYLRQVRMFHRLTHFKRLGVAYEDTPDGRIYAAMPAIEKVAVERGFELVTCNLDDSQADRDAAGRACLECMQALAANADAIYLTALLSIDEQLKPIAELLKNKKVPSFSMLGSKYVKEGILMSISTDEGYEAQGFYDAGKIARILNGAVPRTLEQVFPDPLDIAINMATAKTIGFTVPNGILRIAHQIHGAETQ